MPLVKSGSADVESGLGLGLTLWLGMGLGLIIGLGGGLNLAYVVSCFVLQYPFRQNQLTTYGYSAIGGALFRLVYIKPAFRAQNTSKHTVIISMHIYW